MPAILGLDIGGANLKAVHLSGSVRVQPFALWKQPTQLPAALASLLDQLPAFDILAVTMTGELCDCFQTKREGVNAILDAVEAVAAGKPIRVWRTDGQFTDVATARQTPLQTAAANWLALATYAGRFAPAGPALVMDIGSTTTDIIPILEGKPIPQGRTDTQRLRSSELIYTGVRRTPICALLFTTVMAELFATTLDVYLLLGHIAESDETDTADGRPAQKVFAVSRMARMIGGDAETCSEKEILGLARNVEVIQRTMLRHAVQRVLETLPARPVRVIVSGSGEFLAQRVLNQKGFAREQLFSLSHHLGPLVSTAACAHAVAVLAGEPQMW